MSSLKPSLPTFSEQVYQSSYKPSGKYSSSDVIALSFMNFIAGLISGVVLFFLRNITIAIGNVWLSIYDAVGSDVLIVGGKLVLFPAAVFVAVLIAFVIIKVIMPKTIRRASCRNEDKVAQSGLAIALGIYVTLESMNFFSGNPFSTISGLAELAMGSRTGYLASLSILIPIVIEALIITLMVFMWSEQVLKENPYCEDCNQWHTQSNTVQVSIQTALALHTAIENDVIPTTFTRVSEISFPRLRLIENHCPNCNKAVIDGKLQWEIQYTRNGQVLSEKQGEEWIMGFTISAKLGTWLQPKIKKIIPNTPLANPEIPSQSIEPKAHEPSQLQASPTRQIEIKNSYGIGGNSPLLVDNEPNLDLIFTDPNPNWPQDPNTQNYADWHKTDIQTKRMALAIAYLQHPDQAVRRSTLAFLHDIPAARVSEVLYDRLMFEPIAELRQAIAEHIWVREAAVNCKYAVNALKDEINITRDSSRRQAAQTSLDLLVKHAPNQDARQAIEALG